MSHDEKKESRRNFSWARAWNGSRPSVRNLGTAVAVIGMVAWMLARVPWYGGMAMILAGLFVIVLGSISVEVEHDDEKQSTS